jgi:hypothetical protein
MDISIRDIEYLNDTVLCKLAPSKIHGVGVVAICDIPKDTRITDHSRFSDKPVMYKFTEQEFLLLDERVQDLILDKTMYDESDDILCFVSPNSECFMQDFLNHSDTPNVDLFGITLRDIKKGEELFEDFKAFTDTPHHLVKNHLKWLY